MHAQNLNGDYRTNIDKLGNVFYWGISLVSEHNLLEVPLEVISANDTGPFEPCTALWKNVLPRGELNRMFSAMTTIYCFEKKIVSGALQDGDIVRIVNKMSFVGFRVHLCVIFVIATQYRVICNIGLYYDITMICAPNWSLSINDTVLVLFLLVKTCIVSLFTIMDQTIERP